MISFRTIALRTICEIAGQAEREYGDEPARALRRRLADIRAAETAADLVVGRPRDLGDGTARMLIDLGDSHRLVFCANHPGTSGSGRQEPDWSKVRRVKILDIEGGNG